jgi:uncharacterized protein (TIRG00374 family)
MDRDDGAMGEDGRAHDVGPAGQPEQPGLRARRLRRRALIRRLLFLGLTAAGLLLVWPTLWGVVTSWPRLGSIRLAWFAGMAAAILLSYICVWWLYRMVLHIHRWYLVATAQLASSAFGRFVPGGAASAGALMFSMLTQAGVRGGRVATSITAVSIISGATILALPLFALPVLTGSIETEGTLRRVGLFGLGVFGAVLTFSALMLAADRPLHLLGRALDGVGARLRRRPSRHPDIAERLLAERDVMRSVLGRHWYRALLAAFGQRGFDFAALLMAVTATGAGLDPLVVLLAYAVAQILTIVPLTPGGLGFVEVGLVGFLGFAGIPLADALLATLAYRLVAYWAPLPAGGAAYLLYLRRYGRQTAA